MGMTRILRSTLLATVTLLSAPTALAQEATAFDLGDEPPPLPESTQTDTGSDPLAQDEFTVRTPKLQLGVRGAAAQGKHAGHALAGFTGGYRLLPSLELGGYADIVASSTPMSDDCPEGTECDYSFQRFGARASLHLLHDFIVDPWLAATIGGVHVSASNEPWRADFAVEVGVDVRPTPWLSLGPYISVARALEPRADYDGFSAVGGRLSVQFDLGHSAASKTSVARR